MDISVLTTGQRIRLRREARGMTRPVLAGLVGRSADWLKKIERGERQLNSLALLLQLAGALGVSDLADLTGTAPAPVSAWKKVTAPGCRQRASRGERSLVCFPGFTKRAHT
jgi:transcriptional regulator with XRE-family HTH domain